MIQYLLVAFAIGAALVAAPLCTALTYFGLGRHEHFLRAWLGWIAGLWLMLVVPAYALAVSTNASLDDFSRWASVLGWPCALLGPLVLTVHVRRARGTDPPSAKVIGWMCAGAAWFILVAFMPWSLGAELPVFRSHDRYVPRPHGTWKDYAMTAIPTGLLLWAEAVALIRRSTPGLHSSALSPTQRRALRIYAAIFTLTALIGVSVLPLL